MKTHLKHLLALALMVLIFSGCQNSSGPETPEVNEPPVVETPEDTSNLTKVEFIWASSPCLDEPNTNQSETRFRSYAPLYLLDLHFDSELNSYAYGLPEGYDKTSYSELIKDKERFKEFSEDAFEKVFGTKYYKEGTVIDLKKWTSRAISLTSTGTVSPFTERLYFSTKDISKTESLEAGEFFEEIIVGNENILVYIYFESKSFDSLDDIR